MRICRKCGKEFDAHGRGIQICQECRTQLSAPRPKAPKSPPVAAWDNGLPQNDFRYCSEELRRTGATYSLHCEGGPMSQYCKRSGQDTAWGHCIKKLSPQQATDWAQAHGLTLSPKSSTIESSSQEEPT